MNAEWQPIANFPQYHPDQDRPRGIIIMGVSTGEWRPSEGYQVEPGVWVFSATKAPAKPQPTHGMFFPSAPPETGR